ncbi:sugar transferase [Siccirubricoccus sp. G192]|uniref:sugar transferase n=1 Tax=Siccirubricoccus sp. G192 TaxID=2849651 RepID=UPI0020C24D20|nr:sugar transferase [Siccirubricoccus sp. G192]
MPVFALIALCVKADGGPAFFAHERVGRGGRRFGCLKFPLHGHGCRPAPGRAAGTRPRRPRRMGGPAQAEARPARHLDRPLPARQQPR